MDAQPGSLMRRFGRPLAGLVLYAGVYSGCYWLSVRFGTIPTAQDPIAAMWLPSGLQVFALLSLARRWWPSILLTGLAAELLSDWWVSGHVDAISVAVGCGNALEAVLCAALVRTLAKTRTPTMHRAREVVSLGVAAVCAPAVNAAVTLPLFDYATWSERWLHFHVFWIGDATGIIVLAPALLALSAELRDIRAGRSILRAGYFEMAALVVTALTVVLIVFGRKGGAAADASTLALVWPVLAWAAFRLGPTSTALVSLGFTVLADLFTRAGRGPYGSLAEEGGTRVAALQGFLIMLSLSSGALAAGLFERQEAQSALANLGEVDPVTGLPTVDVARRNIERLRPLGAVTAVLVVDLDDFTDLNERHGRLVGDDVLRQVGERLRVPLRTEDVVARGVGGRYIVVIGRLAGTASAELTSERVLATLTAPVVAGNHVLPISACSGLALVEPRETVDRVLARALASLEQAKLRGPGCSSSLDAEAYGRLDDARRLQSQLNRALAAGELEVHYQPIVDVRNLRMVGVEALVRWRHPQRGLLVAAEFIPGAESSGLVVAVDDWVLGAALRDLNVLRGREDLRELTLFVNLSARSLAEPHSSDRVREALRKHGVAPTAVVVEITETALVDDSETGRRAAAELSGAGVSLAIDDFGQGHSSLARLRALPISVVKIDQSFVSGMVNHEVDDAVVSWTTTLAQQLRMSTVAEGVETPEQLLRLMAIGVDFVQGFGIARPMPLPELLARVGTDGRVLSMSVSP